MYYNLNKSLKQWNIYGFIWRIIVNEIILTNNGMPMASGCGYFAAQEDFFHADRTADFNVMIYVTDGIIYVTEDNTDYEIRPGELLFLKSGIRHFGKRPVPKGTRWHFVHFYLDKSENVCEDFVPDCAPLPQYEKICCRTVMPKKLTVPYGSRLERLITEFTDFYGSSDPMKKWQINARLFELLTEAAFSSAENKAREKLSDKIAAFLADNYDKPFSSEMLEKTFFLSYKHMAAVFRRERGVTMQQYHNAVKMNAACKLLVSTLMTVGEISARLGYNDMLYFSRRFREFTGKSPTEYRKTQTAYLEFGV